MKKTAKPVSLHGLSPETLLGYPQAQPMETPGLQKAQRVLDLMQQHDPLEKESATMAESPTPHLDLYFEKLSEAGLSDAQRRYPELLKVAAGTTKTPALAKRRAPGTDAGSAAATPPVQSSLSGGAA